MTQEDLHLLLESAERCRNDVPSLMRIIEELERNPSADTPALIYGRAYAWYLHPERSKNEVISRRVEDLLRQVLRALPSDYLSLLYLGHNAYDRGEYLAASGSFAQAASVAPKDYIGLKSHEMLLCCKVMMTDLCAALEEFHLFVTEASSPAYEPEDIWPRELAAAIERRGMGNSPMEQRERAIALAVRLDRAGNLHDWLTGVVRACS